MTSTSKCNHESSNRRRNGEDSYHRMDPIQREVLNSHRLALQEEIPIEDPTFLSYFLQEEILTDNQIQHIQVGKCTKKSTKKVHI